MMQEISEGLHLKQNHRHTHAIKLGAPKFFRAIIKTVLLSLVGLALLVGFSGVVWVTAWHGDAQYKIGQLYEDGSRLIPQNYAKACAWYGDAAAKGDINAQLKLAEMHAKGQGVHQDLEQAFVVYRSLADQGHDVAQYKLGEMYLSGQGVAQNIVKGLDLLQKSANLDNVEAAFALGKIYSKGFGEDAEEQNILSDVGVVYHNMDEGVSQNAQRSAAWYLQAAMQGHAEAQSALGMMYFEGKGVTRNDFTAYILEAIAAARGSVKAPIFRNQVMGSLSQDQIVAAQPLIDHWVVGQPVIFAE